MNQIVRTGIAYIAGRLITGKKSVKILDELNDKNLTIDGIVSNDKIDISNKEGNYRFSGSGKQGMVYLYEFNELYHIELRINGNRFEGFDHGSSSQFTGEVNDSEISIFDYGSNAYFEFTLQYPPE